MTDHTLTLTGQADLLTWAGFRCAAPGADWNWGRDARAMGVIERESGRIVAVMVLNAFFDQSAMVHIASDRARNWATPRILAGLFHYIYVAHGLERVVASTHHDNKDAILLMVKLGFTIEARLRTTADGTKFNTLGTMFRTECPWLRGDEHGQERTLR